jgi:hypothetical protein
MMTRRCFGDRRHDTRKPTPQPAVPGLPLLAAALLATLAITFAGTHALGRDALEPTVAMVLFALAAAAVGAAWLRRGGTPTWSDAAGILTFIGVAVTMMIEPDQMVRLMAPSAPPE